MALLIGESEWKIQYYDYDLDAWVDWIIDIFTDDDTGWTAWTSGRYIETDKIRIVLTDWGMWGGRLEEMEMRW